MYFGGELKKKLMKKSTILTFIFVLFSIFYVNANAPTVIKGKITNMTNPRASLTIEYLDPDAMEESRKTEKGTMFNDGTFYIETEKVSSPYMLCWLHVDKEITHFYISPGDSVYVEIDALNFDESLHYSGKHAGQFNYRRDYFLQFWDSQSEGDAQNIPDPAKFYQACSQITAQKRRLLTDHFLDGNMDTSYYHFENKRLTVEYHKNLLQHYQQYLNAYVNSLYIDSLSEVVDEIDINDSQLFVQHVEFRMMIPYYATFQINRSKSMDLNNPVLLSDKIEYAKNNLEPSILRFYVKGIIQKLPINENAHEQTLALLNYIRNSLDDPFITKFTLRKLSSDYLNRFTFSMISITIYISVLLVLVLLLLMTLKKIKFPDGKKLVNSMIIGIYGILSLPIFFTIDHLHHQNTKGLISLLMYIPIFFLHTYYVLPRFNKTRNMISYILTIGVSVLMVIGVPLLLQQLATNNELLFPTYAYISVCLFLYSFTILLSWLCNGLHTVNEHKTSLKKLFQLAKINKEYFFNALLIIIVNLLFLASSNHIYYNNFSIFYISIALYIIHTFMVIPKILLKKDYLKFVLVLIAQLVVLGVGEMITNMAQTSTFLKGNGISIRLSELIYLNLNWTGLFSSLMIVIPALFYNIIKNTIAKNNTEGYQLFQRKEAELQHLRSQVNPHFLFNSLNTLYAYALQEENNKTAEPIAKLANLMRYMIDDMDNEFIPLKKEVSYIEDYIKLQSIRSAVQHDIDIQTDIHCDIECMIAPMLLIPFVENAFKHGVNPNKKSHLRLDIMGDTQRIQFYIENSRDPEFKAFYKEKGFGMGIENVKRRLEHIYPGKHEISVTQTHQSFVVIIKLAL